MRSITLLLTLVLFAIVSFSQDCTTLGQNPGTAFPVCGISKFVQKEVPICGNRAVPGPCGDMAYTDKNPFWYKFTAFSDGTLGFIITPNDLSSDYDWQLFDITNARPEDVYTNKALFVACNWSGETGITGAAPGASAVNVCGGTGKPLFSKMPDVKKGRQYLLMISHFTDTQFGYTLEFKGGTASITDPQPPAFASAEANCDAKRIKIKLNKKMKCSSLAANGSDFIFSDPSNKVVGASAVQCSAGFDMDEVEVLLQNPLTPGNYSFSIKNGSDLNAIVDNCENPILPTDKVSFTVTPALPTLIDSISKPACAPGSIEIFFRKGILTSSITASGSDIVVTGPSNVSVKSANFTNSNGYAKSIRFEFNQPIYAGGTYTLSVQQGTDGNTFFDECGLQTPVGTSINFALKDTVNADFTYAVNVGCVVDTLQGFHNGANGVNTYSWNFEDIRNVRNQNPVFLNRVDGSRFLSLKVSNGFCEDSASVSIPFSPKLNADFAGSTVACPNEVASFVDQSTGPVFSWNWDFGNGSSSNQQIPGEQQYVSTGREKEVPITLIISDGVSCYDTIVKPILVVPSCVIAVPSAFTPNNDGKNDWLYPSNAYKASELMFRVYNRFGQVVFETRDWTKRWDGTFKGKQLETGSYVYFLQYTLSDTGKKFSQKGTTVLIR